MVGPRPCPRRGGGIAAAAALSVAIHALALAAVLLFPSEQRAAEPVAILVEFAPPPQPAAAEAVVEIETAAEADAVATPPQAEPPPAPEPAPQAEVPPPKPKPKQEQPPKRKQAAKPPPQPARTAAQPGQPSTVDNPVQTSTGNAVTAEPSPHAAAAPIPQAMTVPDADPYGATLLSWLERYRTYPRIARMKGLQGTVQVKLRLARNGAVLDSAILHGSGEEILDEAVRDLIRRADPMPPLPDAISGSSAEFIVPIAFSLK